jgi:DNA polymerase (family 10)
MREIAALLRLEGGGNEYRARAYERGADVIEPLGGLRQLVARGELTLLPGIGPALARVIDDLVDRGRSPMLERLRESYPPGSVELSRVLSLPKVRAVHDALGITTLAALRTACRAGLVRGIKGFGAKSEQALLERIDHAYSSADRRKAELLPAASAQAEALVQHFRRHANTLDVAVAGALRRRVEAIDRLDLVVASSDREATLAHAERMPGTSESSDGGDGRIVLRIPGRLDAHVRVVEPRELAVALVHGTGTSAHVEKLAAIARARGLALDDHSLRKGSRALAVRTEDELYTRLGLPLIEPELREDAGEIEAAERGRLPTDLLTVGDIRGAVHCHTTYSDGNASIEDMARAAESLGLAYITITDHSASATYAHGLDVERLRQQKREIDRVQKSVSVRILHGTESDILRDGSLDFPEDVLRDLDVIVASIHTRHKMDIDQMTERVVRALKQPLFKVWGHALGRYVLSRPPFECHMDRVLDAAAESRVAIEVNGDPHRLDMAPEWIREARTRGLRFVVSTDAHATGQLRNVRWGVDMARRGWLTRNEVLNTLDADEFARAVKP